MLKINRRYFLCLTTLVLLLAGSAAFADASQDAVDAQAAFEMLKGLAGQWSSRAPSAEGEHAMESRHVFRVSANGSVVMETMHPDTEHEMINMYHVDGDDLVLTHYCAGGNQPQMKLDRSTATSKELRFDFTGGTNLDPSKDQHIHGAKIVFVDGDHVQSAWTGYQDGAEAGVMVFELARAGD